MREKTSFTYPMALATALVIVASWSLAAPSDVGMYGNSPSRNMVSSATGLPSSWDPSGGENIKWKQQLGSQSYGGPVLAGGVVYVGTNNGAERGNPRLSGRNLGSRNPRPGFAENYGACSSSSSNFR